MYPFFTNPKHVRFWNMKACKKDKSNLPASIQLSVAYHAKNSDVCMKLKNEWEKHALNKISAEPNDSKVL